MEDKAWDRRSVRRYPLELDLTCRLMKGRRVMSVGKGKTCNLSSRGVLFVANDVYDAGSVLWLSIKWPAERGGHGLELSIIGRVLRSDSLGTAVQIMQHGFEASGFSAGRSTSVPPAHNRSESHPLRSAPLGPEEAAGSSVSGLVCQ